MRKLEILIYGICLIAILFSCQNVQDETVTLIKQGRQIEYHIKTHLIKDSFHMKLSDYASDFEFIPLETKDECLISYGMDYYFGDKYFLLEKRYGGIYQFGRDGRFIRKLVPEGKGPHDFWEGDWTVDEENQILYLSDDAKKNYFLQYDLKSGAYLGDLKKAVSCRTRTIEYLKEGLIMVNTYGRYDENGLKDYVYWQDLSGKLLSSVPARKTDAVFWSSLSNANYGDFFRLKILNNDTIYSVDNRQLTPYLTFDYGKETPTDRNAMGYVEIRIDREIEPWTILDVGTVSELVTAKDGTLIGANSRVQYYVVDKKQKKAFHRGSTFIDPLNQYEKGHWITYNKNGWLVKLYQAVDLIETAEKALADPEFKDPYRSKFKALVNQINENDNPILLVGRFK